MLENIGFNYSGLKYRYLNYYCRHPGMHSNVLQYSNPLFLLLQFRFASKGDVVLIIVGVICAMGGGAMLPLMIVLFGDLTSTFVQNDALDQVWLFSFWASPNVSCTFDFSSSLFPGRDRLDMHHQPCLLRRLGRVSVLKNVFIGKNLRMYEDFVII